MYIYKDVCPYAENTTLPKVYKFEIYTISEHLWEQRSFKLTSNSQLCIYPQNLLGVVYLTLKLGKWLCFYSFQLRWKSRRLLYAISSTALTFHTGSSNNLKTLKQKTFLIRKNTKTKWFLSECLLRLGVLRVFVLFCVFVCVRGILSYCP